MVPCEIHPFALGPYLHIFYECFSEITTSEYARGSNKMQGQRYFTITDMRLK
jgi:hypothetical protein